MAFAHIGFLQMPNFMSRGRLALADFCGQFKVWIQNGRQYKGDSETKI